MGIVPLVSRNGQRQPAPAWATLRPVGALVLREMATRFGRSPGGYLWAIVQPLGIILILGYAFSLIARTPVLGTSYILFKATGLLPFMLARQNAGLIAWSLSASQALLQYPGVTWAHAILARFVLSTLVSLIVSVLILTGISLFEGVTLILDWADIALAMGLAALTALSWGTLNAFLFERAPAWSHVWGILNAPLMLMSGIILPYENLPGFAREVLWYNPLLHITGLMRAGFYSTYQPQYVSVSFVVACALVPLVFGLLLLRRCARELLTR